MKPQPQSQSQSQSQSHSHSHSLVNQLAAFLGLNQLAFALVVGLLLVLLLVLAAYAQGGLAVGGRLGLWQLGLAPAIVVYVLGVYPLLQERWVPAIDALRPLAARPEFIDRAHPVRQRGEWAALLLGAAFAVWVSSASWSTEGRWLAGYVLVSNIVMFGLMALAIYGGLLRSRQLTRIVGAGLQLDLFDRQLLTPLARWGQSVSLAFVGGICLSLLFQSYEILTTLRGVVIYSIMVIVSLTLFFTSMWSIHGALVAAQERELAVVRKHWNQARLEARHGLAQASAGEAARLYEPVVVLGAYESQLLAASTWPFNPKIVKEVVASLIAPVLIYGLKVALGLSGTA